MSGPNCPSRQGLADLACGRLRPELLHVLAEHVEQCPECQNTIAALGDREDTLVAQIRRSPDEDAYAQEPECQAVVSRAKSLAAVAGGISPAEPAWPHSSVLQPEGEESTDLGHLGEYELVAKLGEGGMGAVYKARQPRLDRIVALKVLSKQRTADPSAVARFEREMKAVGRLNHPNIVQAYDARDFDGTTVLVMEYVEGMDLAQVVEHRGALRIADACELVRQATLGLQAAHKQGLVHRDIKPSNLMLTTEGQVKILDLGLALLGSDQRTGEADSELTSGGQAMGTADYMAPEQVSDSHSVDIRADIYSMGCTLYKFLTGHAPFSGPEHRTQMQKFVAHLQEVVPSIHECRADVPEALAAIIERMLAKSPAQRYATPAEVAAAIAPFAAGCDLVRLLAEDSLRPGDVKGTKASDDTDPYTSSAETGTPGPVAAPSVAPVRVRTARRRLRWTIAVALGLAGVGLAFGIMIRVKDRSGRETVIQVPDDAEVTISRDVGSRDKPGEPAVGQKPQPKPVAVQIPAESLEIKPGDPLSRMSLVAHPAPLAKAQAWAFDTHLHRGKINACEFDPTGQFLVTAGEDGTVRMWDATSFKLLSILHGHDAPVLMISWFRGGQYFATGDAGGEVCIWDAKLRKRLRVLKDHPTLESTAPRTVCSVAWSSDGTQVLSGGDDKTVRLWHVASGWNQSTVSAGDKVSSVSLSPDRKCAAYTDGKNIVVRDALVQKTLHTLSLETKATALAFSSNSSILAGADHSGLIYFWDVASGNRLHADINSRHVARGPCCLAFSADGKRLATGGGDNCTRIWDVESGLPIGAKDLGSPVNAVAWAPDGKSIVSVAGDGEGCLRRWNVEHGQVHGTISTVKTVLVFQIAWSPDRHTLALGSTTAKRLWLCDTRLAAAPRRFAGRPVGRLTWMPDGQTLVARSDDGAVHLMDATSAKTVRLLSDPSPAGNADGEAVEDFDLSADGRLMAAIYKRKAKTRVIEVATGKILHSMTDIAVVNMPDADVSMPCSSVALSADGRLLATAYTKSRCSAVFIRDLQQPDKVIATEKPEKAPWIAFARTGKSFAFGNMWDSPILELKPDGLKKVGVVYRGGGAASTRCGAWSAKGTLAVAWPQMWWKRPSLAIWDAARDKPRICRMPIMPCNQHPRICWSPDGSMIGMVTGDAIARVWDPVADRLLAGLAMLGTEGDASLAFSGDGHFRILGDLRDDIVYVVQTDQGEQLTLSGEEFTVKYGWKNDPAKVSLTGDRAKAEDVGHAASHADPPPKGDGKTETRKIQTFDTSGTPVTHDGVTVH